MAERAELIARKQAVHQQLERIRRQLEYEETLNPTNVRRIQQLRNEHERLMAEEYTLRIAIDRSRPAAS